MLLENPGDAPLERDEERVDDRVLRKHFPVLDFCDYEDAIHEASRMPLRRKKLIQRKPEAHGFRVTLGRLRQELGITQETLALRIGVTARTLSNWENGLWLPPLRSRLHILLALRDAPPEYVVHLADLLGLSADPAHQAFLKPFRDAVKREEAESAGVTYDALRTAVDAAVREVAEDLDRRPADLRRALSRVLDACVKEGATLETIQAALRPPATRG